MLVAGSLTIDTTLGRHLRTLGGVATYGALTFARHGLQTTAAFRLAPSESWAADRLERLGVSTLLRPSACTTRFVQSCDGELREQWMPDAAQAIDAAQLCPVLQPGLHVHFGPLHPGDIAPEVFLAPGLDRCVVSLDIQGLVRACDVARIYPAVSPDLAQALQVARFVKASDAEMDLVCRSWGQTETQLIDRFGLETLLVTSGSRGGRAVHCDGSVCEFRAAPAHPVIDTTGAGDVFFAAWLARRLHVGDSMRAACRHAADTAALHVQGRWLAPAAIEVCEHAEP